MKPSRITALVSTFEGSGEMERERGGREKRERGGREGGKGSTVSPRRGWGNRLHTGQRLNSGDRGRRRSAVLRTDTCTISGQAVVPNASHFCRASLLAGFMLAPPAAVTLLLGG